MDVLRQFLALALVFGLLLLALHLLRRKNAAVGGRSTGLDELRSTAKLRLSPQHTLHLVTVRDREFAIAVHPAGVVLLGNWPREVGRSGLESE